MHRISSYAYINACYFDDDSQAKLEEFTTATLPDNPPSEDEINLILPSHVSHVSSPQTTSFADLPAEIRNRIYHAAMTPAHDAAPLVVASPFTDRLVKLATQPAITRVSQQLRAESLQMFYTNHEFVAYIEGFDFSGLIRWIRCITSQNKSLKVTVHVKLLDQMKCSYDLADLVRAWRMCDASLVHLEIHNCYPRAQPRRSFDQRALVVKAIALAEALRGSVGLLEEDFQAQYKAIVWQHAPQANACFRGEQLVCPYHGLPSHLQRPGGTVFV